MGASCTRDGTAGGQPVRPEHSREQAETEEEPGTPMKLSYTHGLAAPLATVSEEAGEDRLLEEESSSPSKMDASSQGGAAARRSTDAGLTADSSSSRTSNAENAQSLTEHSTLGPLPPLSQHLAGN